MAKRKRKKKNADELGTENELLKLKMMAEFGGDFMGNDDIPPEMENQFLKNIINFHKAQDQSKITTVYKFIGAPEYNHVSDMGDKELEKELKRIIKLMEKNLVSLHVLAPTPNREVYRFITEELFQHEIQDVKIRGWINQFVYEDFYPNADYDVRGAVFYCLQSIFEKGNIFFEEHYNEDMKDPIGLSMEPEDLRAKIESFWNRFHQIKLGEYDYTKLNIKIEEGIANAVCEVGYKTQTEKGKRFKLETTTVELNLVRSKFMDSVWEIKQIIADVL